MVLAVIGEIMQHYGLSAPCDLGYVNEKISGTFIGRILVETLPCRWACIEFIVHVQACCYKTIQGLKSNLIMASTWQYRYAKKYIC